MRTTSPPQLSLRFSSWGGARAGAGRKPGGRARLPHVRRPTHCARHPIHITLRLCHGLPSLRGQVVSELVRRAFADSRRCWFRVTQYSIQTNHVHVLAEADDRLCLSRGIAGLTIRLARRLNALLRRRGRVWIDRYHARALRSPREVRRALAYVLLNFKKHGGTMPGIDPLSSGEVFDGWREASSRAGPELAAWLGVQPARTWLLRLGWRQCGLIGLSERPAAR